MRTTANSSLAWPLRAFPILDRVGIHPMSVPGCNRNLYLNRTIVLHLHDYAGAVWIGKRRYRIEPGDITLTPSEVLSRYELPEGGTHFCVHFYPVTGRGAATFRLPLHVRLGPQTAAARERFWRLIDHMRRSKATADSPVRCAASATLQEFLLWLSLQGKTGAKPRRGTLIEEALMKLGQAIETSFAKPMPITELAAGVGLSADYVARLFAKRYGMTLQHYLRLRRIELARHLLVSTDLPIAKVGQQVGIPDPQYFNKQFWRMAGQSPLAYRRAHQIVRK